MCCGPSSRPFLRETIAEPGSLLSKYPLETNLVVTSITTLFQLAIYQHLLGKDVFFPSTLRYIFSHFEALNPTHSKKEYRKSQRLYSNHFQENLQSSYLKYYFCLQNLGSINYQCVHHCLE